MKIEIFAANFNDKKYAIQIRNLKQALSQGLIPKKRREPLNSIKKLG